MRTLVFVLTGGTVIFGCVALGAELVPEADENTRILGVSLALSYILLGFSLFIMALRRYRGGWMTVLGALALVFMVGCIAAKVNEHFVSSIDSVFGLPVAGVSAVAAFLLLYFGHRRHRALSRSHEVSA